VHVQPSVQREAVLPSNDEERSESAPLVPHHADRFADADTNQAGYADINDDLADMPSLLDR
jgi:hypothetical protein